MLLNTRGRHLRPPTGRAASVLAGRQRAMIIRCGRAGAGAPGAAAMRKLASISFVLLLLQGCASTPAGAPYDDDPLEPMNRAIFEFNNVLDGLILEPAARMYRFVFPQLARDGIANFLDNLRTPVVLANDLMQGEFQRAEMTLGRFMLNTVLGVGGIIDVGGWAGMPERHSEDFGQTLAVYGTGSGPYLVLPLLGPSNPRDAAGLVVDALIDPFSILFSDAVPLEARLAQRGAMMLRFREENLETIEELKRSSIDYYAATRTLVQQLRTNEIRNGAPPPLDDIYDEDIYDEDIYDEPLDDPEEPADDATP
jgi:phospholipid-binding lipoprotein MlaA